MNIQEIYTVLQHDERRREETELVSHSHDDIGRGTTPANTGSDVTKLYPGRTIDEYSLEDELNMDLGRCDAGGLPHG